MRRALRIAVMSALAVFAAACGGDNGTAPTPVATLRLEPTGSVELQLGDSTRITATARDDAGNPLTDRTVTWRSSDASVAQVDANGLVTGVSGGTATITASVESASASVSVTVDDFNIAATAVVIDSTRLTLVSDSTERAGGTYRFQVIGGTAPNIAVGSVIVGAQAGGFLRKVTAVNVAGGTVTLTTDPAALVDVLSEGEIQDTIDLLFAPASPPAGVAPLRPGQIRWGAPVITYQAPGLVMNAAQWDLSGSDLCALVKKISGGVECPDGLKAYVKSGSITFDPKLDLGFHISKKALQSFHAVAEGDLLLDFDLAMEAQISGTAYQGEAPILTFKRPFWFQVGWLPVAGVVEGSIDLTADLSATAKGSIQAGFTDQHTVKAGAAYRKSSGWSSVLDHTEMFDGREPQLGDSTLSGQIQVTAKVGIKPDLEILFYGVAGPYVSLTPYGLATLDFGTHQCDLKTQAGVDLDLGFTIAILDPSVGTFNHPEEPWFAWDGEPWTCPLGTLDVSTITNGDNPDPDGYTIVVDTTHYGAIGSTDQKTVPFIQVGERQVGLEGVASNCTVTGDNPRTVTVPLGVVTPVAFDVECTPTQGPYFNDFNSGSAPHWTPSTITTSPSGEPFLGGPFGNSTATLTLDHLPDHTEVDIELDFYALRTIDGNLTDPGLGPDVIAFTLDGTPLKTTTFSNNVYHQSYPDDYPGGDYLRGTGATSHSILGYTTDPDTWSDSEYHITFSVPHTATSLQFKVQGSGQQGWPNEGWGLDNVSVTVR